MEYSVDCGGAIEGFRGYELDTILSNNWIGENGKILSTNSKLFTQKTTFVHPKYK